MVEWKEDTESYKFKTLYVLEYSHISIKIIFDTVKNGIASAHVTVKDSDFVEVDVRDSSLEEAKRRLIWAAINVGSSLLTKQNLDNTFRRLLLDNLMNLYKIQVDLIKAQKADLRALFNRSRRNSQYE